MRKKKIAYLCLAAVIIFFTAVIFYFVGYKKALKENQAYTFYAIITDIGENYNYIKVEGLETNDINHRGSFVFSVEENTMLEWRNASMKLSEFDVGDCISITYTGNVMESYPAKIEHVIKIQLLEDEK